MNIHEMNEAAKAAGMTYGQYVNQTEEPVPVPEPKDPYEEWRRTCPVCGKTFMVDRANSRKVYCGVACRSMKNNRKRDSLKAEKTEESLVQVEDRALEEENRALRTELATNHIGDVNKKGPDQEAKADAGKPRLTLVPPRIIWEIATVREFGTAKYHDPENWRTVEPDRLWAACTRHIVAAWNDYRATDADSGLLHLAHAATNIAFLLQIIGEEDQTDG